MTRQKMALIAALLTAAVAVVLGLAATWTPALAGPAVALAVLSGALVVLALFAQLRAERRYRWALQKRLAELQHALGPAPVEHPESGTAPPGSPDHPAPDGPAAPSVTSADYASLARIHDRLHALETTLGPRP